MIERRQESRQRSLLSGRVVFDDNICSMDCTVRNLSPHGALIVMSDSYRLPREFDLRVPHREEAHAATVIWRRADAAGLALTPVEMDEPVRRMTPRMKKLALRKKLSRGLSI